MLIFLSYYFYYLKFQKLLFCRDALVSSIQPTNVNFEYRVKHILHFQRPNTLFMEIDQLYYNRNRKG